MQDSSFGRLIGVLFAPAKTFASIREKPTWLVPMLVLLLISAGVLVAIFQEADFGAMIQEQMAAQGRQGSAMSDEQQQMAERWGMGCVAVTAIGGPLVIWLIVAGIYMVFNLFGGELRYPVSLSVLLYGSMPAGIAGLLSIPVILARDEMSMSELQSGRFLQSNLGFLAPEGASAALTALLSAFDLFSLWGVVLLIIGYHAAARVKKGTAATVVIALWLLGVGLQVGLASLRGLQGG